MINHIHYLNLDSRKYKNRFMENQLRVIGIPYTRISGVVCHNYRDYTITDRIQRGSKVHKGTIGCFLGHMKCLESIVECPTETDNEYFCILEDDVVVTQSIFKKISRLDIPTDCEILSVGSALQASMPAPDESLKVSSNMYKIPRGGFYTTYPYFIGAFFYVVTKKIANKILEIGLNTKVFDDYDSFLFENFAVYTYIDDDVFTANFKSDRDPEAIWNSTRISG